MAVQTISLAVTGRGTSLDSLGSDSLEKDTHAFVIRIWKEEPGSEDHPALWRGHITHAYTGERQFFQDLSSLLDFIESYLNADL